jgi:hypothetical protein
MMPVRLLGLPVAALLITLGFTAVRTGQLPSAEQIGCGTMDSAFGAAHCLQVSFAGELSTGQTFQRKFGDNLLFRLNPVAAHHGWTIEILPQVQDGTVEREYIWVVTPPYRFYNPHDIDTSYGTSAGEAVRYSPRDFNFVLNEEQFKRAADLVNLAIMSHPQSDQRTGEEFEKESVDAIRALKALPVSKGRLSILDSHTTASSGHDDLGSIEWLKFRVELQIPCAFAPAPNSDVISDASKCDHDEAKKKH